MRGARLELLCAAAGAAYGLSTQNRQPSAEAYDIGILRRTATGPVAAAGDPFLTFRHSA